MSQPRDDLSPADFSPAARSATVVRPSPWWELLLAAIALAMVVAVTTQYAGGRSLLARPMWFDEYLTHLVVTRPTLAAFFEPFRAGPETNLPLYHLVQRLFAAITPGITAPTSYRVFSLGCALITLITSYALLRRSVDILTAFVGVMALWSLPSFIEYAFEARYYAWLTALSATLALLVELRRRRDDAWLSVAIVMNAAVLTWSHWFGLFSVASISLALIWLDWRRVNLLRTLTHSLWPLAAGGATILLAIPLYVGQKSAGSSASWINPNYWESAFGIVSNLFGAACVGLIAVVTAIAMKMRRATSGAGPSEWDPAPILLLASPVLIVPLLLLTSAIVEPVMVTRYAAAAMLAVASMAAALTVRLHWGVRLGLLIALVGFGAGQMRAKAAAETAKLSAMKLEVAATLHEARGDRPILFQSAHDIAAVDQLLPNSRQRLWFLSDPTLNNFHRSYASERAMNSTGERVLGFPARTVSLEQLRPVADFWLVASLEFVNRLRPAMPERRFRLIIANLYAVETIPPATRPSVP